MSSTKSPASEATFAVFSVAISATFLAFVFKSFRVSSPLFGADKIPATAPTIAPIANPNPNFLLIYFSPFLNLNLLNISNTIFPIIIGDVT